MHRQDFYPELIIKRNYTHTKKDLNPQKSFFGESLKILCETLQHCFTTTCRSKESLTIQKPCKSVQFN